MNSARIAADDRLAAEHWIARLVERVENAIVPELGRAEGCETYPRTYRIVYRTDEAGVCVLTVFEGSACFNAPTSTKPPQVLG